jgi:hypothetical protein
MKGTLVLIRGFEGRPMVRKVWDIGKAVVYVTDDKNYELLVNNAGGIAPIGVPKEDVFEYDEKVIKNPARIEWEQLIRWTCS